MGVGGDYAIELLSVNNVTFTDNIVIYNDYAIFVNGLNPPETSTILFSGNEISDNLGFGLDIEDTCGIIIENNNFRRNGKNVLFIIWYPTKNKNKFNGNYWDRPRIGPAIILGFGVFFTIRIPTPYGIIDLPIHIPWFNIDWNPAREPYDI